MYQGLRGFYRDYFMLTVCGFVQGKAFTRSMHDSSLSSMQCACCLDFGFRHMFSAHDCDSFHRCILRGHVNLPALMLTLAQESGSLVGREFAQLLGTRLLVSVLRGAGATRNIDYIWFYSLAINEGL